MESEAGGTTAMAPSAAPAADSAFATAAPPAQLTLIALKGETIYGTTDYWIEGSRLFCLLGNGAEGVFDLNEVDWGRTAQLNAERGITVTLRARPHLH